jgi:hypothetical protein
MFSLGKFHESEPHPSFVELLLVPPTLPLQQMFDVTLIFMLGGEDAALKGEEEIEAPTAMTIRIIESTPIPNPHF